MAEPGFVRVHEHAAIRRLVGECCELGSDPNSWHYHLFDGLRPLVGYQIATAGMADAPLERMSVRNFRGMIDVGWSSAAHRAHCAAFWMSDGFRLDPIYRAQIRTRAPIRCMRPQDAVADTAWRRSMPLNEYYRVAEQEEMMCGVISPPPDSGVPVAFVNLLRPRSDPRFSPRDRDVLCAVLHALRPHVGVRLTPFSISNPPGITRRMRQVMAMLLRGCSEKEIAWQLGLAPASVHDYIKRLHKALGVSTRRELLTAIRRMLAPHLAEPPASIRGRPRDVLHGLLQGRTETQIARELGISSHTVHDHVKQLCRHAGVHGRGQLLFWCAIHGTRDGDETPTTEVPDVEG